MLAVELKSTSLLCARPWGRGSQAWLCAPEHLEKIRKEIKSLSLGYVVSSRLANLRYLAKL